MLLVIINYVSIFFFRSSVWCHVNRQKVSNLVFKSYIIFRFYYNLYLHQ